MVVIPVCSSSDDGASVGAAASSTGGGGGAPPMYGAGVGGSSKSDAGVDPNPFPDAGGSGGGDAGGCDDGLADTTACDALMNPSTTCLTTALCDHVNQLVAPRVTGMATSCIASLSKDCSKAELGACLASSAALSCHSAPDGTAPCNPVAMSCTTGDPFGAVATCLSIASVLTANAAATMQACLMNNTQCDPSVLTDCAAALFP